MNIKEHAQIFSRSMKYLFALSKTYFFCVIFNNILKGITPYVPIYFSARLLDALYEKAPLEQLLLYAALTVGIVFLLSLLKSYISYLQTVSINQLFRNERWNFSEKALDMAFSSIEDPDVARLRSRIKSESQTGYNLYYLFNGAENLSYHIASLVTSLSLTVSFFAIGSIPLPMKLAFIACMLLTIACGIFTTGRSQKLYNNFYDECVDTNILADKYMNYVAHYSSGKDIRLYDMSSGLRHYGSKLTNTFYKSHRKLCLKQIIYKLADTSLLHCLRLGTYLILIYGVFQGGVSVGSIAKYVSCIMLMLTAISGLVSTIQITLVNNKYLKRYFSYFDIKNTMYQGSLTVEKRDDNEYFVEFRDVSFRYPNTESYALRHVNLKFKVGEKLAVVGMNGSGKTTFIKLMCRLYDPTEGEILLNGVNIKKYDYDEYMSIFSVLFQDFSLFSFSLGQNVAAASEYDPDRARQCLVKAGFGERLESMPKGLDTCLYKDYDKDGVEISGGEAQKIAIARALYKDAPFIILDEPTAALDPVSEYEVYSKFNQIAGEKTAIYISHRLASCRFCDKIAVFHQGQIVQVGSHGELLAREDGKYYELWHAQAQYYTDGGSKASA